MDSKKIEWSRWEQRRNLRTRGMKRKRRSEGMGEFSRPAGRLGRPEAGSRGPSDNENNKDENPGWRTGTSSHRLQKN